MSEIIMIGVDKLHPHPDNPRKELGDLTELTASIKAKGVLQNLTVVPQEEGEGYTVIIGHRRHAAAMLAGLEAVPCVVTKMTPEEQVETMLLENMQRSDLTPYEQAKGFQLMLDMGRTVEQIVEKSGFSETTVRHRLKMAQLDEKKFKASSDRGATLQDYLELERVEDIKERNKLLQYIGTENYRSELKKALDAQKQAKRLAEIDAAYAKFARKVDKTPGEKYRLVTSTTYWEKGLPKPPEDADTAEYVYRMETWGAQLFRKRDQADAAPEADAAAEERAQAEAASKARLAALKEASKRAYALRREFVEGLGARECRNYVKDAVATLIAEAANGAVELCVEELDLFGLTESEEEDDLIPEKVLETMGDYGRAIVRLAYVAVAPGEYATYYDWAGKHRDNPALDQCYAYLAKLGYQMSQEEKSLQDGSHEMFRTEKTNETDGN